MSTDNDASNKLQFIIDFCRKIDFKSLTELLFAHEAPEYSSIHGMPRLSVLVEGCEEFACYFNNTRVIRRLTAPAIYYCTRNGYLWSNCPELVNSKHKALSFCYMSEYIRISFVNTFDPATPQDWNLIIHTHDPLSAGGFALLNAFETLYKQGNHELGCRILNELWDLTLEELSTVENALTAKYRPKIWSKIDFYLRSNRTLVNSREEVAKLFHISPGYLSRLAKKYAGRDFISLVTEYKLEHAVILLKTSNLSIDEISDECGFKYRSYFDRRFKLHYGMTPREYRDR